MRRLDWFALRFAEVRPKALAALNHVFRNLDLAEESLAIACEKATKHWTEHGEPHDPFAWLLTTARNAGLDILRKERRRTRLTAWFADDPVEADEAAPDVAGDGDLPDDLLRLLFICCHPALSPQDQSALALRVVAGLPVNEIARAFIVKPAAMEKRLVRARAQIGSANIAFGSPDAAERQRRLRAVSLMIYLMFNEGWSATSGGPTQVKIELCEEAIRLARLLVHLFPTIPELQGLLALCLFHYARREGRLSEDGQLQSLDDQNRGRWDEGAIREATTLLDKALRHADPGPYQIQAAIAAAHALAATAADTDWGEIEQLYRLLVAIEPSPIIRLNHAAALARTAGPERALQALEPLSRDLEQYRWFHTTRAGLLMKLNRLGEAKTAFERALQLGPTDGERNALREKIALCEKD